jgi:hypothetical protein
MRAHRTTTCRLHKGIRPLRHGTSLAGVRSQRMQERKVIQLTLIDEQGGVLVARVAPFFRITGRTVWTSLADGGLVRFTERGWNFQGRLWVGMNFEGPSRLVMGISKDPTAISEVLQSVSIFRDVAVVNGIPFSVYEPASDMWRSALVQTRWHAFRIETALGQTPVTEGATASRVVFRSRVPSRGNPLQVPVRVGSNLVPSSLLCPDPNSRSPQARE